MTVAVGILALLLLAGAGFALGSRPLAIRTAVQQFDAQLHAARALAASTGNGATVVVQPLFSADGTRRQGFKALVYAGRPTGSAMAASGIAPIASEADIEEASIGAPAFGIFISSSGHVSMQNGFPSSAEFDRVPTTAIAAEPACPAANGYTLIFRANGSTETIQLPCGLAVSGTPMPIVTNTPTPTPG